MDTELFNITDIESLIKYLDLNNHITGLLVDDNFYQNNGFELIEVKSPINGKLVIKVKPCNEEDVFIVSKRLKGAFEDWRNIPAPKRGELVRRIGNEVRKNKEFLASIITLESGKTKQEALGEIQEWIDICDFAVGLSRQLHGLNIASERPDHRLLEQWQPLGIIGVISAFNFPVAVWAWNAMLALVCGNTVIWKPSEQTPLCAFFSQKMLTNALDTMPELPRNISAVMCGGSDLGEALCGNIDIALISATGSTRMGKKVAIKVAERLGKSLLELGGNNSMIVTENADQELALRAIVFSAVGTTGQRCTTLRRLFLNKSYIETDIITKLVNIYDTISIGDPNNDGVLIGPLINEISYYKMQETLKKAEKEGSTVIGGDRVTNNMPEGGYYVTPAIVIIPYSEDLENPGKILSEQINSMKEETFAPILYVMYYNDIEEAIKLNNQSDYGLSSCIFSNDIRETELFLSQRGSDCGIANVNIGTSGAEIGGAFGGEKDTGGGRESGSDCWKNYMRRQTVTINYGKTLPLAQGIKFDV